MIRIARTNARKEGVSDRVHYIQGVVERMEGIASETYDLVISRDSLHHWDDPGRAFGEISRVLKADGKVYIRDSRRDLSLVAKVLKFHALEETLIFLELFPAELSAKEVLLDKDGDLPVQGERHRIAGSAVDAMLFAVGP